MRQFSTRAGVRASRLAIMVPHAGYVYSGKYAAAAFDRTEIPETVVILCPNHTGKGQRVSIWSEGEWVTPLGPVKVDVEVARAMIDELGTDGDKEAHLAEHAIEVQLPFLQQVRPDVKIVPIVVGPLTYAQCRRLGESLAHVIGRFNPGSILLVASSDMSHYISATEAERKDRLALEAVEKLDAKALYSAVTENDISMCGFVPTTVVLEAAKQLDPTLRKAEIVAYGNSGEATGDFHSVVAYAAALIG